MSRLDVTVVVPTWNEEAWLPGLLRDLARHPDVRQVVVADHTSEDRTREVARERGCFVVPGGRPATGRNRGAAAAGDTEFLLFADADVRISEAAFGALRTAFSDRDSNLVFFRLEPVTGRRIVGLSYKAVDLYAVISSTLGAPHGTAPVICVRRSAFEAVGGFDEAMGSAEDADFIRRVGRAVGGVVYCRTPAIRVSARRFDLEPFVVYAAKCCTWGVLRAVGGRRSVFAYRWDRYGADVVKNDPLAESVDA